MGGGHRWTRTRTRPRIARLGLAAGLAAILTPSAAAPAQPPADGTGIGGPGTTITAPDTDGLGVTEPPGTALGPGAVPAPEARRRERARIDGIERSICDGCD